MLSHGNKLEKWLDSDCMHEIIAFLIIVNAIVLGLETYTSLKEYLPLLHAIDKTLLIIFTAELALRVFAGGFRFFRNGWHLFDAFIILISIASASSGLSALRAVRILRVMRLISLFPQLRIVVSAIYMALPGALSVAGILMVFFYIFSIVAFNLFNDISPEMFSSLGGSMYTLFQLMLCDDWSATTRPILAKMPHAYLFFIPFVVTMTFCALNLFFGLIVNAMQSAADKESEDILGITEEAENETTLLTAKIEGLTKEIQALKALIRKE